MLEWSFKFVQVVFLKEKWKELETMCVSLLALVLIGWGKIQFDMMREDFHWAHSALGMRRRSIRASNIFNVNLILAVLWC